MRPRCLFVIWPETIWLEDEVKKLLEYAWSKKFLDFTVLKMNDNSSGIFDYNPFRESYNFQNLLEAKEMFPDKIKDVNKYPLTMPMFDAKPQLVVEHEDGKTYKIRGKSWNWVKIIMSHFNFSPDLIVESNDNSFKAFNVHFVNLEESKYRLIPLAFMINPFYNDRKFIIGNTVFENKVSVMVPVIKKFRIHFTTDILMFIVSFPLILLIFFGLKCVLKLDSGTWSNLYVYQIFIGLSARKPNKLAERVIFLLLAGLSIVYANVFLTAVGDMKMVNYEQSFGTYQDLVDSKMKMYTLIPANPHDTNEVKSFLSRAEQVTTGEECADKLIETRSAACVLPYIKARSLVKKNLDAEGVPIMKLDGPTYFHQYAAFAYEKASPFADKFDKLVQLIKESGIMKIQNDQEDVQIHSDARTSQAELEEDTLVQQLLSILFVGYLSAMLAFVKELNLV